MKKWMICIEGTRTLKEGEKYLVEFRGLHVKVIRDEFNPYRCYGNIVKASRFRTIQAREEPNSAAQRVIQLSLSI